MTDLKEYKPKDICLQADHLDCDVKIKLPNNLYDMHVQAGNYLIYLPNGRIYPAKKELFEYIFELSEEKENE